MRRFEFSDGKSNKFWEIEVVGGGFTTCHGRIGAAGRETSKQFGSPERAAKLAESAIASKLKKGYVEVTGARAAAAAPAQAETPIEALERRLIANPDALDDWLVYADALAEAGDPRGELVTVGVSLAQGLTEADAKRLRQREDALLQQHAEPWFGKFVSDDDWRECFGWTLQTGFWGRIRLWIDDDHNDVDVAKALAYALAHPSAKFLRQLDLGLTDAEGSTDYEGCIRALIKHGPLPSLRRLTLGDFEYPEQSEISWVSVGRVAKLWPLLSGLEELTLQGAGVELGVPKSASLRALVIRTGGLPRVSGEALARAELPELERLDLWFGTRHYNGSCTAAEVRGLLQNPCFVGPSSKLRRLALANADFADDIAGVVAQAKLPPKLEHLDLSMGTLSDTGAELLLAKATKFAGLAGLDLRRNFLSPAMCARVQEALPHAQVGDQKPDEGEDERYVSVGE